jgi:hypothetical protein
LARTVIRTLVALDEAARDNVVIAPGAFLNTCEILHDSEGYVVAFAADGRRLRCALAEFQARTEPAVHEATM